MADKGKRGAKGGKGGGKARKVEKAKAAPRRFDEPFRPLRNYIVDVNPGYWADHCRHVDNIVKRWEQEHGSLYRRQEPRSRSLSPSYHPTAENPEMIHRSQRARSNYCVRAGNCIYCHLHPCVCFTVTYGGSATDLRIVDDPNEMWRRVPMGCLQMQLATNMVSDPGPRMITYEVDPTLRRHRQEDWDTDDEDASTSTGLARRDSPNW